MTSRRIRPLIPLIILGLLHVYIGVRLLPDLASNPGVRVGGSLLLVVSCGVMLAGLMSRSMLAMSLFSSLFVFTLLRDFVLLVAIVALPARHVHLLVGLTAQVVVALAAF